MFVARAAEIATAPQKLKDKHVKLLLRQEGRTLEALGWDRAVWADSLARGDRIDAVFTLQTSTYLGEERLYLSLEDVGR